jgi:CelD/BcsL family acetyltransferase involved in cellulose biosynthesis
MQPDGSEIHTCPTSDSFGGKPAVPYSVETCESEAELLGIEADWNRLSETAAFPNAFTTFGWFRIWTLQFINNDQRHRLQPYVLVLRQDGKVTGIAPFIRVISSRFGLRVCKLEFVTIHADYNELVLGAEPADQTRAVIDFLARRNTEWDIVDLRQLHATPEGIRRIEGAVRIAGLTHRLFSEREQCPYMTIDGPFSKILNRRSRRTRDTFRRMRSRLEGMAAEGLRVRIVEQPHEEPGLLQKMISIEAQKHVGGKLSSPFLGRYPEAFSSLLSTLGPRGWLAVGVMEMCERLLAWELVFRCGRQLWSYQGAYDHKFARLSPGTMLLPAFIDYGFSRGFTEYDFLSGEESYKLKWATGFHRTYRLLVWNPRWMSTLCAFAYLKLRARPQAQNQVTSMDDPMHGQ